MALEVDEGRCAELCSQVEVFLKKSTCLLSHVNFKGVSLKAPNSILSDAFTETKIRCKGQSPETKDSGHQLS